MELRKQEPCKTQFQKSPTQIEAPKYICKLCFHDIREKDYVSVINRRKFLCYRCFLKLGSQLVAVNHKNIEILRICRENEYIKSVMINYVLGEDYELKDIFLEYYVAYLKWRFKGYKIYYLELDKNINKVRSFNKLESIYECLGLEKVKNIEELQGYSKILIAGIAAEYHENYLKVLTELATYQDKKVSLIMIY